MKKHSIVTLTLVLTLMMAVAPFAVRAEEGSDDGNEVETELTETTKDRKEALKRLMAANMSSRDVEDSDVLSEKKQERKDKLEARRAAIMEKLSGKRKELCEKHSDRINEIIDKRVVQYRKHLGVFNAIRDRLVDFVAEKNLGNTETNALEEAMNTAQVDATAALDTFAAADFSCENEDASKPGGEVRRLAAEAKQALKDYRTAIKDYAKAVKSVAEEAEQASEGGEQ